MKVIAAILTKVYNLSDVYDTAYMLWYTREASVAVYVANLPLIWPLLREWFPFLRNLSSAQKSYGVRTYGQGGHSRRTDGQQVLRSSAGDNDTKHRHELDDFKFGISKTRTVTITTTDASSSFDADDRKKRLSNPNVDGGGAPKRRLSSASDEMYLNSKLDQTTRTFWGTGDITAEVTIEVERESVDLERGDRRRNDPAAMQYVWDRPDREVRMEGVGR